MADALSRLRTLMAEQPFSGAAGRVQDRLARAIVSEEAVWKLAKELDPDFWNSAPTSELVVNYRKEIIGSRLIDPMSPADFEAHPSMVKARAILEALAADAVGDER